MMPRPRGEDGAVLVLVVLTIVAVFGAGALVVDAGALWMERRSMVTATDAAALAAVSTYGQPSDSTYECGGPELQELIEANAPGAVIEECTVEISGPYAGYVTVTARSAGIDVSFAKMLGMGENTIPSSSSAMWGTPSAVIGLRPIALCMSHPSVQAMLEAEPEPGAIHRIDLIPNHCGLLKNWAWVSFDGTGDLDAWLTDGYPEPVVVGESVPDAGDVPTPSAVEYLIDEAIPFPLLVYPEATGSGGSATYEVAGFLGVLLRDYDRLTGTWLDIELTRLTVTGNCCNTNAPSAGLQLIRLCGVDNDTTSLEVRCADS